MGKKLFFNLSLVAFLVVGLTACKQEIEEPNTNTKSTEYLPLGVGNYAIYDLDSTIYDDFNAVTYTRSYECRHMVSDTFLDNLGRISYIVDVATRRYDSEPWQNVDVFYVTPTTTGYEFIQNNIRKVNIAFPIADGNTWLGNSMVPTDDPDFAFYKDWLYKYEKVGQLYNGKNLNFDETITVLEHDYALNNPDVDADAYAERTKSSAVYAKGVGLVNKVFIRWVYDSSIKYRSGYGINMNLKQYYISQ
jgi:hypothetical protein